MLLWDVDRNGFVSFFEKFIADGRDGPRSDVWHADIFIKVNFALQLKTNVEIEAVFELYTTKGSY